MSATLFRHPHFRQSRGWRAAYYRQAFTTLRDTTVVELSFVDWSSTREEAGVRGGAGLVCGLLSFFGGPSLLLEDCRREHSANQDTSSSSFHHRSSIRLVYTRDHDPDVRRSNR